LQKEEIILMYSHLYLPAYLPIRWPLAFFAAMLLVFVLFAGTAGFAAGDEPAPHEPQREELTIDMDAVAKPWTGDLDGMIERGMIRVLTTYSKTFYFMNQGVQRGLTHDAFSLFEEDLNKKLAKAKKLKHKHIKVRVVFVPVGRDELLPALAAGKGDIAAANLTVTPERQKLVDFASPVYSNVSELLVSGPASPTVSSVEDLSGKEVFVRRSSSFYESLVALNQRLAAAKKPAVTIREAPEMLETEDLIEMVNAGLVPLTVADKHIAGFWKQVFPGITVHEELALRTGADIAWAMRKNSPQLKAAIDDFMARNRVGSTTGNVILARYLKNAKYVKDAASESERRKFLALVDYFRKYGEQYDVDWLLMAAQGYQESQLNQDARSKVGAIGVMQVMPATGKDLKVGDIAKAEPNIHAGVKYMRWMIDNYYGDEPMTRLDKALFAFASYNAGAGRISQLRKQAAKRGLNPNVWFHNVEYLAAEKIGAETVTYVGNIYKYYIAYSLLMEARAARERAAQQLKDQGK
jgi:membrane-bound lytic murein transglycosylase MltF